MEVPWRLRHKLIVMILLTILTMTSQVLVCFVYMMQFFYVYLSLHDMFSVCVVFLSVIVRSGSIGGDGDNCTLA